MTDWYKQYINYMITVKFYGVGSIENLLAHACYSKGWDVPLCDIDAEHREDVFFVMPFN